MLSLFQSDKISEPADSTIWENAEKKAEKMRDVDTRWKFRHMSKDINFEEYYASMSDAERLMWSQCDEERPTFARSDSPASSIYSDKGETQGIFDVRKDVIETILKHEKHVKTEAALIYSSIRTGSFQNLIQRKTSIQDTIDKGPRTLPRSAKQKRPQTLIRSASSIRYRKQQLNASARSYKISEHLTSTDSSDATDEPMLEPSEQSGSMQPAACQQKQLAGTQSLIKPRISSQSSSSSEWFMTQSYSPQELSQMPSSQKPQSSSLLSSPAYSQNIPSESLTVVDVAPSTSICEFPESSKTSSVDASVSQWQKSPEEQFEKEPKQKLIKQKPSQPIQKQTSLSVSTSKLQALSEESVFLPAEEKREQLMEGFKKKNASATLFHEVLGMLKKGYNSKEDIKTAINAADVKDWGEFFKLVATEASLFVAETGSEVALKWLIDCMQVMPYLWNEKSVKMFAILLTVVYTFYDFALDVKRRFGITDDLISSFFKAVKEFKITLKKLMVKIGVRNGETFISFMNIVSCTYNVNVGKFFIAKHEKGEVEEDLIDCSPTFKALHYYNKGLLAIHFKQFENAEELLANAFRLIRSKVIAFSTKTRYLCDILFELIVVQLKLDKMEVLEVNYTKVQILWAKQLTYCGINHILLEFCLFCFAIVIGYPKDLDWYFVREKELDFHELFSKMALPANWATTILNYITFVNPYLTNVKRFRNPEKAVALCDYIWKNYNYMLSGKKSMAFAANLFLILRYDVGNRYQSIRRIGTFFLKKYNISQVVREFSNYVLIVKIFMADLHKQCEKTDSNYLNGSEEILESLKGDRFYDFYEYFLSTLKNGTSRAVFHPRHKNNVNYAVNRLKTALQYVRLASIPPVNSTVKEWRKRLNRVYIRLFADEKYIICESIDFFATGKKMFSFSR